MPEPSTWPNRIRRWISRAAARDLRRAAALPRFLRSRGQRWLGRVTLLGFASALAALGFNVWGAQNRVCSMGLVQPWMTDTCGAFGLGGRPSKAERLAWDMLPPGDCAALEEYVRRYEHGTNLAAATQRLQLRRRVLDAAVSDFTFDTEGYANHLGRILPTRALAEAEAAKEAIRDASERHCKPGDASARLVRVELLSIQPGCSNVVAGFVCGADYRARCVMTGHRQRDWCGPGGPP